MQTKCDEIKPIDSEAQQNVCVSEVHMYRLHQHAHTIIHVTIQLRDFTIIYVLNNLQQSGLNSSSNYHQRHHGLFQYSKQWQVPLRQTPVPLQSVSDATQASVTDIHCRP